MIPVAICRVNLKRDCRRPRPKVRMNRLTVAILVALPVFAQSDFPHHNFTVGVGAGLPRGELRDYFSDKAGASIGYGYRFHRYFQADAGMDIIFGAARVRDYMDSGIGTVRIRDREYLLPLGGRAIAPFFDGRLLFSGGGGVAYMNYRESVAQPSEYYRVSCPYCTSRDGWGYYTLANASVFLDRARHWRVGVTGRVVRGKTTGEPLGTAPAVETRDHWVNLFAEVGFSF